MDDIKSCSTFKGDITLQGDKLQDVELSGIKKIQGSLNIKNVTQMKTFSAPDLQEIEDSFSINVATVLNRFAMPKLTKVGSINWVTLPQVRQLAFDAVVTNATDITISDTGLTSLDGINVQKVGKFDINNNKDLKEVNVDVASVSNSLDISFNAQDVATSFPYLLWANNITFRDCGEIQLPNITSVNASLGFINNTVKGIQAPNLKKVGGSVSFVSNRKLSNVSFPKLTEIGGGFQIANNTHLKSIMGFPKVKSVAGAIDFQGNFDTAVLPALSLVRGGVDIDSKSDKFNCSSWDKAHKAGDIHGDSYICKAKKHSTSVKLSGSATADANMATGSGGSGSSTKSKDAAVAIDVTMAPVAASLFAFVLQYV